MAVHNFYPLVTILVPVNRNHEFLKEALESILNLDYPNVESIIIDNSDFGLILHNLSERFKILRVPSNFGLSKSMNYGIDQANGKYIFVMHSDDVADPKRVLRQVGYMESNPSIDILGCGIEIIGDGRDPNMHKGEVFDRTVSNGKVREFLMYKNPLFHPTVVFRTTSLSKLKMLYRSRYDCVEDLELWMRASRCLQISNIPDVLLKYRIHDNQLGQINSLKSELLSSVVRIRHNTWLIFHDPSLRNKASRALVRNFVKVFYTLTRYIIQNRYF